MNNRVTVNDTAKILGVSPQYIRIAMQKGALPIGSCVQISSTRWTYHISKGLLDRYTKG